jgi:DNA polymerase-3 subunit chi
VLLTCPKERPATYANLAYVDGIWRDPSSSITRIFYFFDGEALDNARSAWRTINADEIERRYWKQTDEGRWIEGP